MQPHASELEEAIIGACLIEQEALELILSQNLIKPQTTDNQVQITT